LSRTSKNIDSLFERIDNLIWGPEERALIEEAIALAVESADSRREYDARMRLTASASHTGDTDAMLASFAWCLARHDESPKKFPLEIGAGADLLWQYKWMAEALASSARFPRAQISAVIADMAQRYDRAGLGKSGVLSAKFLEAWAGGRLEDAEQLRLEIVATPIDDHSQCEACVRSDAIGFLAEIGKTETCDTLMDEMLEGGMMCGVEPETALGRMVLPYLRLGQFENAKSAHLRSYRLSRGNADYLATIGRHLVFCAVTGNEARGLAMLERHLAWLAHDGLNQSAHFEMLCSMAVLLDAVSDAGFGETAVAGSSNRDLDRFFGSVDRLRAVEELATACWAAAAVIGAQFDARNANAYFADQTSQFRMLASERYDVPIQSDVFVPAAVSSAEPTTPAEWLLLAQHRGSVGEFAGSETAARRVLDGAPNALRIDLLQVLLQNLVANNRLDEAEELLQQQISCLRNELRHEEADLAERVGLGMTGRQTDADRRALEAEARAMDSGGASINVAADVNLTLGFLYWAEGRPAEAATLVAKSTVTEDSRLRSSALRALAQLSLQLDNPDAALDYIDRVLAEPVHLGNVAAVLELRAQVRGGEELYTDALRDGDEALAIYLRLDARRRAFEVSLLTGKLLTEVDRYPEAVQRYRFAISQAKLIDESPLTAEFLYGRALAQSGLGAEACEVLEEVFAGETAAEVPAGSRGLTLDWLARAQRLDEQYGNAVVTWNNAVELFIEADDLLNAASAATSAGRLLDRFDEHDDAIELLTTAVERARSDPGRILLDALHALGTAQANDLQEVSLDTLDEALTLARGWEADWIFADITDSRARALQVLGRLGEAADTAAQAAGLFTAAGDPNGAGQSNLLTARILVEAERQAESTLAFKAAIDLFADEPQMATIAGLELGDVLERLGRLAEAEQARALAES